VAHRFTTLLCLGAIALVSPLAGQALPPGPAAPVVPVPAAATPAATLSGSDKVGPVLLRDETLPQVLELLQRWTGKTVLRPQALPAATYNVTLPDGATRDEALQAIETLLSLNGVAVIPQGDRFLKIVPNTVARAEAPQLVAGPVADLPLSGRVVAKLFHLQSTSAEDAAKLIAPMLNSTLASPPVVFARTNTLLVTDSVANLRRIEAILADLDQPRLGVIPKAYELQHANATALEALLRKLFAGPLLGRLSAGTAISVDERTNRLIVVGDPRQHAMFDQLVAQLDVKSNPSTRTEVLPLRHANAPDVATLLTQLITGQNTAAARATGTRAGAAPARPATPAPAPGGQGGQPAAAAAAAQSGAEEFSQGVTVVADTRSNSLVVSGTGDDLRLLKALVGQIDVVLAQVRIEVVIAEVSLSDSTSTGIEQLGLTVTGSKLTGFSAGGPAFSLTNGAVLAGSTTDLSATIGLTATPRKGDTNILSNPSITTTHNKEATIFVGESRPVVTGTTTTPTGGSLATSSNVSQRDIGIELKVLPLIGQDGSVQLQVSQKVEDILGTVQLDGNEQPRIGRRETQSFVSARSGEIIVLGGLQRSQQTETTTRLGGIPLLGDLLGGTRTEDTKTELLIFLRPYVLTGTQADNVDALRRLDDSAQREPARAILDRRPGESVPAPLPEAK
jgi:general secretion pathway protein D